MRHNWSNLITTASLLPTMGGPQPEKTMKVKTEATITIGEGVLTIARSGQSKVVVANILGVTTEENNRCWYLDRLVHAPHETELGDYQVSGAISSKLYKPAPLAH
jgi:hypothetical protein